MSALPASGLAVELAAPNAAPRLVQRPVAAPHPGEALIRIDACGVCGSDVFLQKGGFGLDKFPIVPGHEAAGEVIAVGDPADKAWVGTQVAAYYIDAPPGSRWATGGHENIGPGIRRMGVEVDGGFSQYVVRPLRTLVAVDPPMDPAAVAVASDAIATPFHALTTVAGLKAGETLVVIGLGGIGSNAVQIGKHLGARVIAVGRGEYKLHQAEELGADVCLRSNEGVEAVRRAADGQADVVVQCVGNAEIDRFATDVAGCRGRVVFLGASNDRFELASTDLIWRELALLGSRGYTRDDIDQVVRLVRDGALRTEHLTQHRRPLAEVSAALSDIGSGSVTRTVLEPWTGLT